MDINLAKVLVAAINDVNGAEDEASLYADYSGRGMYGSGTAGVVCGSVTMLASALLAVIADSDYQTRLFELQNVDLSAICNLNLRQDSMGRDVIIY